jgi:hypothetical protein
MNFRRNTKFIILLAFVVAGCASTVNITQPDEMQNTLPAHADAATTQTSSLPDDIENLCIAPTWSEHIPDGLYGSLVLDRVTQEGHSCNLLVLDTNEQIPLPGIDCSWGVSYSPDLQWIFAWPFLINANGERREVANWQDDWALVGWLNPESLLVSKTRTEEDEEGRWHYYDNTLFLLNPFTGQWKILSTDFPGIFSFSPAAPLTDTAWTWYDPSLSLATYIRSDGATVLINVQSHEIIWERDDTFPYLGQWSPDGNKMAIPVWANGGSEVLVISRAGVETQVTNITGTIKNADDWGWAAAAWSPQGNYIHIFFSASDYVGFIDTLTQALKIYCLEIPLRFHWSPDETKIALGLRRNQTIITAILDFTSDTIYLLEENSTPVAWLAP